MEPKPRPLDSLNVIRDPAAADDEVGRAANFLIGDFQHQRLPMSELSALLESGDDRVASTAAWLAQELGDGVGEVVVTQIPRLLTHRHRAVRANLVDVVLTSPRDGGGELAARAIVLVDDEDAWVRSRVVWMLSYIERSRLLSSAALLVGRPDLADRLAWLLAGPSAAQIGVAAESVDRPTRLFAVAAATRAIDQDTAPILSCAASEDLEVRDLAQQQLQYRRIS